MAKFKPTVKQQRFVEMAERRLEAELAQPKRKSTAFSRYFLDKCSSELGIERPSTPRVPPGQWKIFNAVAELFGHDNWLMRLFRRH